jgi:hypothetical protein
VTCNYTGSKGTCIYIPFLEDPYGECPGAAVCNGHGGCGLLDGEACAANGDCLGGNCVDGVCCNLPCTGLCQACSAAKKGAGADGVCGNIAADTDPDNECPGAATCNGSGACGPLSDGQPCSAGSQCTSSFCVDGVCCNNACQWLCEACNLAGSVGTCTSVPAGQDPDDECPGVQTCNGSGVCS